MSRGLGKDLHLKWLPCLRGKRTVFFVSLANMETGRLHGGQKSEGGWLEVLTDDEDI